MAKENSTRLSAQTCRDKAEECRMLAKQAKESHRIMLLHMAETWDRIAATYETNGKLDSF